MPLKKYRFAISIKDSPKEKETKPDINKKRVKEISSDQVSYSKETVNKTIIS